MTYTRKTVANTVAFEGRGLHTGQAVKVSVNPSQSGLQFRLGDDMWEAVPQNVTDTNRCTRLGLIATVEHLMSALAGAEITDALIEVSATELPALDGSAGPYFEAISAAGCEAIGEVQRAEPFSRIFVQDGDAKIAISSGSGHWRYEFHTGHRWPGTQILDVPDVISEYPSIASARTFAFEEELSMIEAAGLGKGLDRESALVLGTEGYLNPCRMEDEPVRHKMLDAAGDIYLAGIPLRFLNVVAIRTGHAATVRAATQLRAQIDELTS